MSDEQIEALKRQVTKGKNAEDIVTAPIFQEAVMQVRAMLVRENRRTKYSQDEVRRELWRKDQALDWVVQTLEKTMKNGQVAEKTLLQRLKLKR